ncbi:hypothetical protein GE09DRAFT_1088505 [Coniochaeta sp. 2T2.1]|nr:hypothetical protein GE09DRAFT_1088505 [Coniochaeta sp. 2T2.1]
MACPNSYTLRNLEGRFRINKQLSDNTESLLALQGIGWAIRKLMVNLPVGVNIKSFLGEDGIYVVDVENTIGGGIYSTKEHRVLDWVPVEGVNANFGKLKVRNGWSALEEINDDFLKFELEKGHDRDDVIFIKVESLDHGRIVVTKDSKRETARLVFDWEGVS